MQAHNSSLENTGNGETENKFTITALDPVIATQYVCQLLMFFSFPDLPAEDES